MGNKKDIRLVIKEKLNQLDKSPNDNGWNAIQSDLDKKKKRRLIPFWFSYVGIFSAGILFLWLNFNNSFDQNSFFNLKENSITTKEKKNDYASMCFTEMAEFSFIKSSNTLRS